jgi:DNA polymerase-3 subunit epsilon
VSWLLDLRRRRWAARVSEPLRHVYRAALPGRRERLQQVALLALDLETTGLNAAHDRMVSAGWCPLDAGALRLGGGGEVRLRSEREVGGSALIHGLRDVDLAGGGTEAELLAQLLPALAGRIVVAHGASIERGFLAAACRRVFAAPLLLPMVCTLALEARLRARLGEPVAPGGLTLAACRARHGLPPALAHDALADAVACAELFLAQVQLLGGFGAVRLGAVLD